MGHSQKASEDGAAEGQSLQYIHDLCLSILPGLVRSQKDNRIPPLDLPKDLTQELSGKESYLLQRIKFLESLKSECEALESFEAGGHFSQRYSDQSLDQLESQLRNQNFTNFTKDTIVEACVHVLPILSAIHGGNQATWREASMLPILERRDALASNLAKCHDDLQKKKSHLLSLQSQIYAQTLHVRRDTQAIRAVTQDQEHKQKQIEAETDDAAQIQKLRQDIRFSQDRYEIIRNIIQGLVLESGVDWVSNEQWLRLMEDCGE